MASPKELVTETEDDSPVLMALCCAADISAEAKTHFLRINDEKFMQHCENFVFVDSLTFKHTAPDLASDKFAASSPDSPFKGSRATESSALLKRIAEETGAYILSTVFAIFDDQTIQDGTILLVQTVDDKLEEMRTVPEVACMKLLQYMIGDADIVEDREDAEEDREYSGEEEDSEGEERGVYRLHEG